jgi:hypothetical protein
MIASFVTKRIGVVWATVTLLAGAASYAQSQTTPAAPELGQLRILYAGHPDSEREKDFVQFLGQYFNTVKTADLSAFKETDTEGFDVTILDYDGDGFKAPRPNISLGFSKPLLTVGVPGGLMCSGWRLKLGYL